MTWPLGEVYYDYDYDLVSEEVEFLKEVSKGEIWAR
jgi:hypothetical protein